MARKAIAITALILLRTICSAQDSESRPDNEPIKIQRINSQVELDGLSNEAAWEDIRSLPIVMRSPNFGSEPSDYTEILLGYDEDYLYAAGRFYCNEPSKIQEISLQRDGGFQFPSDHMAVILDEFNDNENAVVFLTTPAGTRTDLNIKNDAEGMNWFNRSWNTFWDVATVRNDTGWFAEVRIPFSSLRFEESGGQTVMGMTAYRWIAHKNEMDIFPLIPEKLDFPGNFKPSQTQKILFEGIKKHNPLYITPYILGGLGQSNELNDVETSYERHNKFAREIGLDLKYGLTNNLTLDVTVNTDFAQVEADDQMINLTRYSLFFPEKRLFFQERQGNFEFHFEGMNRLFYSRQIGLHEGEKVRIYGGGRIVGRAGPWDIGFLNMQTEKFMDLPSENFSVVRLRRQVINPYSYIGFMVTSRIGSRESWNTAYGIDGIFRLFGDDYLSLKWAQSFENDLENKPASFVPSKIYVNWNRRREKGLGYDFICSRSGDDYNPGIGFERRNNYTLFGERLHYGWFPGEESKLQNHKVFIEGYTFIRNTEGKIESSKIGPGWEFTTNANSYGSVSFNQYIEDVAYSFSLSDDAEVPAGRYTFYGTEGVFQPFRGNLYGISATMYAGSFYDGRHFSIGLSPRANISRHLQLMGLYQLDAIEFPDRDQKFTGQIGQLKVSAFLNSKLSLISLVQYNSADHKIIMNIRFRYNPREGNDLYIVYDEGLNTYREREIPMLPRTSIRTIMVKYSYTFRIGG
jgi:hypothetical protein